MHHRTRDLISLDDLPEADLGWVVAQGAAYAAAATAEEARPPAPVLDGSVVGIYFKKTSTRTRTAFSAGALRLGARIIAYGPDDLQTNTGETLQDTARVMAGMLDALVARIDGPAQELRALSAGGEMAVINAMSLNEHPTQAIADLVTLQRHFGRTGGLRVLYVGEGNSTATALTLALSRCENTELNLCTPADYGLPLGIRARAAAYAQRTGSRVEERHTLVNPPDAMDVIYTTRWQTTGTVKKDPAWRKDFEHFRVTGRLWESSPHAVFMHDLPAHRGEEVAAEVLDGPASIAFEQAENKLYGAMAVLHYCLN